MPSFVTIYGGRPKTAQNLFVEFVDVYQEIPPYAVDTKTGDLLNKTPDPILINVGKKNIVEEIQSYSDSVNIYKILERCALSGDMSFLNRRVGTFGDFVNLPDNINELNDFCNSIFEKNKNVSKSILEAAINKSLTSGDLAKIINDHVNGIIENQVQKNQNQVQNNQVEDNGGNN